MADMIAKVLADHAPAGAKVAAETHRAVTDAWLERLEQHSTHIIAPVVDAVTAVTDPPPEIATLLAHAKEPHAQFGSLVQQFFVYGLMFQLAGTALAPFVQAMANDVWKAHPDRPISPPDLATMVVRGISLGDSAGVKIPQWATDMAAENGLDATKFASLVGTAGMAPNITILFEMIRRGIISKEQLTQGIKQGDIKDEWIPFVEKMRYVTVSPVDMVRAAVQQQMPYDEAQHWAHAVGLEPPGWVGGNPDWFKILYDIAGRPPGPQEAGRMALRGIIPVEGTGPEETTFYQAIAESDVKTKWTKALWELEQYVPPPGEVRTLLMHGGITKEQAIEIWKKDGIPPDIAAAYAHIAEVEQITEDKALAKSDVLELLEEGLIDNQEAITSLGQIGYTGKNAESLVKLAHWRYNYGALRRAVEEIGRYYSTWKITADGAKKALIALGLATDQAERLVQQLQVQRNTTSPIPTEGQISSAFYYGVIGQDVAMSMLADLGYSPWHAWFLLSTRKHAPIPGEPDAGKPSAQPDAAQIAQSEYNTAAAAAQQGYELSVTNAKSAYLTSTPPNQAGYDAAVAAAKSQLDQQLAQAAQQYGVKG